MAASKPYLQIFEWSAADVDPDDNQLGLTRFPDEGEEDRECGVPGQGSQETDCDDKQIEELMVELIASHTLG